MKWWRGGRSHFGSPFEFGFTFWNPDNVFRMFFHSTSLKTHLMTFLGTKEVLKKAKVEV
jgi:hypothetical protein